MLNTTTKMYKPLHTIIIRRIKINLKKNGGRGEIRTLGGLSPTAVFKTAAINQLDHSSVLSALYYLRKIKGQKGY